MSFLDELRTWPADRVRQMIDSSTPDDVERALDRQRREPHDLAALLSPHAIPRLEAIARQAQRLTRWHFGGHHLDVRPDLPLKHLRGRLRVLRLRRAFGQQAAPPHADRAGVPA